MNNETVSTPLRRNVRFLPSWDRTNNDPAKNYGVHCAEILFELAGPQGVVVFTVFTDWYLPSIWKRWQSMHVGEDLIRSSGANINYHSYVPTYEGQTCIDKCDYLGGKPCYCDGSGLYAKDLFSVLTEQGDEALWVKLEEWYQSCLGNLQPHGDAI